MYLPRLSPTYLIYFQVRLARGPGPLRCHGLSLTCLSPSVEGYTRTPSHDCSCLDFLSQILFWAEGKQTVPLLLRKGQAQLFLPTPRLKSAPGSWETHLSTDPPYQKRAY